MKTQKTTRLIRAAKDMLEAKAALKKMGISQKRFKQVGFEERFSEVVGAAQRLGIPFKRVRCFFLDPDLRCGDCNFWQPTRRTKVRWTWGKCLVKNSESKWTNDFCSPFFKKDRFRRGRVIFLERDRFNLQLSLTLKSNEP